MEASSAGRPGLAQALEPDPSRDLMRALGGILFAVGALVFFIRKSERWDDFPLLLVIGIPFVLLFWLAVTGRRADEELPPWRLTLMIVGVLLAPFALAQLRDTLGLSDSSSFWVFCIFAGTSALALYASFVVGAAYQALLAALAGIAAWLALWDWIASPGTNGLRWLLVLLGIAYAAAAASLLAGNMRQGSELVTAAGVVGVLVGVLGVVTAGTRALGGLFVGALGGQVGAPGGQSVFWDIVLLLVSLGLIVYGARTGARGPSYVGFVGLLAFTLIVGTEVNALLEGDTPDHSFAGWPLILLLVGAAGLTLSVRPQAGTRG